jgi:hypothetical protein
MGKVLRKQLAKFVEFSVDEMHHPYQSIVQRMIKKFEETGAIMDSKLPMRKRTSRSLNNIAAVSESVAESPGIPIRNMIMEFLWPQLDVMEMEDMWFQHDSATCHTAHETTELL